MMNKYNSDIEAIQSLVSKNNELRLEIAKVIVGQDEVIKNIIISIFSKGHCLLIGVPGLAKTLIVKTIASTLGLDFKRIQFTPDLMPSDILGSEILDEHRTFRFIKGPVFSNIILADEINRTPPKTQSALLEAMQENAVTVAGQTMKLQEPFFVLATQNPIEHEGTYPLPEAQLDRFMFNVWLDYPSTIEEINIVKTTTSDTIPEIKSVMNHEEILYFQHLVRRIPVTDNVYQYIVNLVSKTRPNTTVAHAMANEFIHLGAGPRASQYLAIGAKCHAALNGKFSPDIEDVQAVAISVLRHRLVRNYKAEAENIKVEDIINELMK